MNLNKFIFEIIKKGANFEKIKINLECMNENDFVEMVQISEKQKVRLPLLISLLDNYSTLNVVRKNREMIDKFVETDKRKVDYIIQLIPELSNFSKNAIFIKGTFLRNLYMQDYGSPYYRYSNDVDILLENEISFWKYIEKLNDYGYIQDEALYIARRANKTEFLTVHYKKRGVRIDLHGLTFPIQLFKNLDIDYNNTDLQIENAFLILLAHSVSHERILLRDLLDFEILIQRLKNMDYFIEKMFKNNLQEVFYLYLKQFYNMNYNSKNYSWKINKVIIYKVLYGKSISEVLKIRQIDFLQRKIIANTKIPLFLYNILIKGLSPFRFKIIYLSNIRHFGLHKTPQNLLKESNVFSEDNISTNHIKIRGDVYYVSRGIKYEI
ncbi:nucleotidyltransferase family protein [Streptococcus intermedius]|uniref:nucleotidyltransferase family protein n=1 Tax=Streptococcus intermedius TaxID=1338 RepID=UPI0020016B28|nr:nucleotidyltransferase family protein [Streptococcus intermedius]